MTVLFKFPMKVLKLELKEIRDQQDLLFRFMNFLKQEGAVHVLQFCLTVGKVLCMYSAVFDDLIGFNHLYV